MSALQDLPMTSPMESARELLHNLLFTHYPCLRRTLSSASELADRIACEHPVSPRVMDHFQRQYQAMADVLNTYLTRQEGWLFRLFCQLDLPDENPACVMGLGDNFNEELERAAADQQEVLTLVDRVWTCLCAPAWADRGALVEELLDSVEELRQELATCVYLEREALFPERSEQLE